MEGVWFGLGGYEVILELFIDFDVELLIVGVWGFYGEMVFYGFIWNLYCNYIFDIFIVLGGFLVDVEFKVWEIMCMILEKFDVVGVLCVEFFLVCGEFFVNEFVLCFYNLGYLIIDVFCLC